MNTTTNISQIVFLEDESVKDTSLKGCTLFVQIGLDEFSFCLLNPNEKKYLTLAAYAFRGIHNYNLLCAEVEKIFSDKKKYSDKNLSVKVALLGNRATLVPEGFSEKQDAGDFFTFNHSTQSDELFFTDVLKNITAKNIFSVPVCIEKLFSKLFSDVTFHHHSSALIDNVLAFHKNKSGKIMVLNVQNSHFEIIVLEENKLLFYNAFKHQTSEDFIYYLLFCCEQLSLNPEKMDLLLVGEVEQESAIYSILQKYVRNVKFGKRNDFYSYSYKLIDLPKHFYYSLFCQYLCG